MKKQGLPRVLAAFQDSRDQVLEHLFYDAWRHQTIALSGQVEPRWVDALSRNLLPAFPDPTTLATGYLRHYHFIRQLSKRHEITLLALSKSEVPENAAEQMSRYVKRLFLLVWYRHAGAGGQTQGTIKELSRRLNKERALRRAIREMKKLT